MSQLCACMIYSAICAWFLGEVIPRKRLVASAFSPRRRMTCFSLLNQTVPHFQHFPAGSQENSLESWPHPNSSQPWAMARLVGQSIEHIWALWPQATATEFCKRFCSSLDRYAAGRRRRRRRRRLEEEGRSKHLSGLMALALSFPFLLLPLPLPRALTQQDCQVHQRAGSLEKMWVWKAPDAFSSASLAVDLCEKKSKHSKLKCRIGPLLAGEDQ